MNASIQAIIFLAKSGKFEFALDEAIKIANDLKSDYLYEIMDMYLKLANVAIQQKNTYYCARYAEESISIHPDCEPSNEIKSLLKQFFLSIPTSLCTDYIFSVYSSAIRLIGDETHEIRYHQIISSLESLPVCSYDLTQNAFLLLFSECLKNSENFAFLTPKIYEMFSNFLWKCSIVIGDAHTINTFLIRAVLCVASRGDRELSPLAARNLYETIKTTKPESIDESIFDHPLSRFGNFLTTSLLSHNFDSYNRVCYCYEKLLMQDVEIPIFMDEIFQKHFKNAQ
ncbi:hypothetical protein GPJ56_006260 [Histomonas meleagridis]|uniref:uncharacterized protein n=1 Tax=Histomonas meleagridis TaxID=135588 RepID=UPI00355A3AFF|nr:hypothetical protein GPJ56_006260 [Histomonas meleagridis]KAH0796924.1 hypothetical protein GO595_010817 [Histomonas meleagridis]